VITITMVSLEMPPLLHASSWERRGERKSLLLQSSREQEEGAWLDLAWLHDNGVREVEVLDIHSD
jgi:hypothetical protein